ncbi:hypothetical protein [Paenibacillus contaminans]|uniref:Uncharacterized protein n=1 Tax=Paenibacillus contaminans TaxID=450362 RepID=A0A329MJD2_9BACL|nr:hypothetical protein [Paenibacillus contaminans]RAV18843.1 hypothetical protein DQG23_24240 [Paenibacillus contaminans]
MTNVVFNRQDNTVVGLNRPATEFGEYSVQLPYAIELAKPILKIDGERQKTDGAGQPLYLDGDDEVPESRKSIAWETVTNTYNVVKDDGSTALVTTTTQVATEWEELPPIMIPNEVTSYVAFAEAPALFTYDEILFAKIASIKANSTRDLVYFDEDFPLDKFSEELSSHAANMGDGFIALHPLGSCRTVKLQLGKSSDVLQIYLESQPDVKVEVGASASNFVEVVNGIAQLAAPANEVYVRFSNLVDRYREVYAFGILV